VAIIKIVKCDCCNKEITNERYSNKFNYLCHIDSYFDDNIGVHIQGDSDGNTHRISEREESKDLCIGCYNKIMVAALRKFHELRRKYVKER